MLDGFTITNGSVPDGLGGGIYIEEADPLIINSVITGNSALSGGGIAAIYNVDVRVEDSSVTGNTATGTLDSGIERTCVPLPITFTLEGGGGISVDCVSLTVIVRSTISDNSAVGNGGGIRMSSSAVINQFSFVTGNSSMASGGGVYSTNTQYTDHTNVVAGNSANSGGGFYVVGNLIQIINSTISSNTATAGGGFYAEPDTTVQIANTILYGNTSLPVFNSNTCISYSDIEGGFAGEGNIDEDPSFVPNGNGNLNADSPCIDAGTSDVSMCVDNVPVLPVDIVGRPRPLAGIYDMGAYEIYKPGDCNGDELIDAGDLTAMVLEVFDGDGNLPAGTPGGTFPGNPAGCDGNEDGVVDAGDLSCVVLLIFNGPGSCEAP